jgi:hypothetical protein
MLTSSDLNNTINELYEKYKHNSTILNKLTNHITNDLPIILNNAKNIQQSRDDRKILLQEAHDKFVKQFISRNIYFYCNTSEIFFKYNNENYQITKEDDIIYNILSTLNHFDYKNELEYFQEQLLPWKFKIKTSIVKQIREISLFTSIPESITIQNIINIFKSIFNTKIEIKYFLTILGDTILKKPVNINIISITAKPLIRNLENLGSQYFGHNPLQNSFRYKYHDHNYQDCRLLILKDKANQEVYEQIQKAIINIFVVSTYYSNRYGSADEYLKLCDDCNLQDRILFLKNNSQDEIVAKFIDNKLQVSQHSIISMKNMLYLWKCYLEEINIPNIIFSNTLKGLLKNKLEYYEEKDLFYNYTSIGLPLVSNFLKFWEETISQDESEYYIEIDELCILFKLWGKKSQIIKEERLINLIKHFFPEMIIEDRFVYGITSTTWNKRDCLISFIKSKCKLCENDTLPISIYELYSEYSTYTKKTKGNIIIGKNYFDLFINNYFKQYINENMISLNEIPLI